MGESTSFHCAGMAGISSKVALIPAAGMGTRLGLGPKALLRLGRQTLLEILVKMLAPIVDSIIMAVPIGFEEQFESVLGDNIFIISGGSTRQESIDRLLEASNAELLLIQDVARPFASSALCLKVLETAADNGAAGAFLPATVPVGLLEKGVVANYWDRHQARVFQAPQAYRRDVLLDAQRKAASIQFQSTAQMVIQAGYVLHAVSGEAENIKITTPLDWQIAQRVIAPQLGLI